MFNKLKKLEKHHQFIYSIIIVMAIVGIWRGAWMLLDMYLFPKSGIISATISLIIGVLILAATHHKFS